LEIGKLLLRTPNAKFLDKQTIIIIKFVNLAQQMEHLQ